MTAEFVPEHCSKLTKNACFNHYFYEITVLGDPLSKSGNRERYGSFIQIYSRMVKKTTSTREVETLSRK